MENLSTRKLTSDAESLARLNEFNQNYRLYSTAALDTKAIRVDFELLKTYSNAYQKRYTSYKPVLGDALRLPDGQTVYFCHIYDDKAQTCIGGSFHLGDGYISFSGGLDSGILFSQIELTTEKYVLPVWFSHRGYLSGGCAIYAHIKCRLWKTKAGADLSGIPQVRALKRQKLKELSETITKVDGNGRSYEVHLPEIIIKKEGVSHELLLEIEQVTGLKFEDSMYFIPVYWCQPMTSKQINALRNFVQFNVSEINDCSTYQLILRFQMKW